MAGRDDHDHTVCECKPANTSVHQTLSEMDWERGIWYAALTGDVDGVKTIIRKAEDPRAAVKASDNSGYTALHYAARNGHFDICQILLDYGAHVDAVTTSGEATPLHKAAATGKLEVVKLLLKNKASVSKADVDGQTVLHRAVERKHQNLVDYFLNTYPHLQDIKDKKGRTAMDFLPTSK